MSNQSRQLHTQQKPFMYTAPFQDGIFLLTILVFGSIPLQLLLPKHSTFKAREQFGQISPFTGASLKGVVLLAGVDGVAGTPWVPLVFSGVGG